MPNQPSNAQGVEEHVVNSLNRRVSRQNIPRMNEKQSQDHYGSRLAPAASEELAAVSMPLGVVGSADSKSQVTLPPATGPRTLSEKMFRFFNRPANKGVPAIRVHDIPLPSPERLDRSRRETTAFDTEHPVLEDSTVLYLAYGSNMCHETFQGRRGIRPLAAINVLVPELKLTFDLAGIPYNEPCFANTAYKDVSPKEAAPDPDLAPDSLAENERTCLLGDVKRKSYDDRPLMGVVYEVTAKDYAHIIATEGATYTDVLATCHAVATPSRPSTAGIPSEPFKAHTLLGPPKYTRRTPSGKPAQPSLRYLKLLRDGARENELPREWQTYLDSLEHYQITTLGQKIAQRIFVLIWAPFFIPLFALGKMFSKIDDRRGSKWTHWLLVFMFRTVWVSHDYFWMPVFGDGERTMEDRPK